MNLKVIYNFTANQLPPSGCTLVYREGRMKLLPIRQGVGFGITIVISLS